MGRIDFFVGVSFVLCFALPAPGCAQSSSSFSVSLTGTVSSEVESQHIARAVVRLSNEGGSLLEQTYSSDSGEFAFGGLRPGRFLLRAEAAGFEAAELRVDLSPGSERGISITLKPAHPPLQQFPAASTISARDLSIPPEARDLLASGRKKLNLDKNPQSALRDFRSAIAKAPSYYEAHYQAGLAYLALQNSAEAEKSFRKSVELSKQKFPDAAIALGTLEIQRGDIPSGEELLRAGLALNPTSWPGLFALGELELSRGRLEPALAAAERARSAAPQQPVVYRLLAVIHLQQKDYPTLLDNLDAYIRLDPDSPAGQRAKQLRADTLQRLSGSEARASAAQ
jgi:tetratricopeptide (TPR) repeat protein